jgi:hypothetical protein
LCAAFNKDGSKIFTGNPKGIVNVIDTATLKVRVKLRSFCLQTDTVFVQSYWRSN